MAPLARSETTLPLELRPGDRIAVVGSGLADRMQHHGWLETYLQAYLPEHQLVVRHLGFTGDELTQRMRSAGFGTPEEWLQRTAANVVFAFFGFNESFRGEEGLADFKKDLTKFVKETQSPDKDQKIVRRVVLFSPIAYEDLGDPLLPPSGTTNERLAAYTKAMAEVAADLEVPFVDLFHSSHATYQQSLVPLTINGIHLNETGSHEIAKIIRAAFGFAEAFDAAQLTKIRDAVLDKNFHWFQRYRTTDGYSIFGGRKTAGGSRWTPKNEPVMVREMEVLDAMTANRDQQIWATAQGKDFTVDDSNTPPLIPIASNKPGPLEDGTYPFLDGAEAINKMTVAKGMKVNLFASEAQFPELQNPVQSAVDTRGRLWVAAWPSYPHWNPKDEMNDKLLILEDNDGDGRADQCKVFADGLHNPTGFEFYNGGVYVAQIPDIWFLQDTDGDDVADVRKRVLGGIDSADTHHSINSFVLGPGGGLHFQEGLFHRTQVETPHGPPVRVADAGVFRYDPRSQEFFAHASHRFANPHGHVFTYWGDDIVHDGTSAVPYFGPAISGRTIYPQKHPHGPSVFDKRTRPCAATAILSSKHFPEQNRDNLLICNVIGEQGILQYEIHEDGAGLKGIETEPLVMSSDPNFRPVDIEIGNDGAVYFLDWQNPLIGHLQHNLRDANRDHLHGRIYRVTCSDRELLEGEEIAGQPLEQLFALLIERDNGIRYRAKIELSSRPTEDVIAACQQWMASLDREDSQHEHHLLEALWVHQHHHVVNQTLLRQLLASNDHRVRAAAANVLRAWREKIADADALVEKLVHDEHPRVRLGGVLICSDIDGAAAAELALETARYPRDKFLDYTLLEAVRTLQPFWQQTLAAGESFCRGNSAAIAYLLRSSKPQDLLKLGKHEAVLEGLATFPDVNSKVRFKALQSLAKMRGVQTLDQLLDLISRDDIALQSTLGELVDLLEKLPKEGLRAGESRFLKLAVDGKHGTIRQGALAALVQIDGSVDRVWQLVGDTGAGLVDLVSCVERVPDPALRALFYDHVRPVMLKPSEAVESASRGELAKIDKRSIAAMAHIPTHESEKLDDLLGILAASRNRAQVVATMASIPQQHWTAQQAARIVATTTQY
ncbi:MAG: PVC-type heme-binding CxxCH protein, partial [Bythopirellula sp.]